MDSRNYIYKLMGGAVLLVAALLWVFSAAMPDTFGWFNFAWFVFVVCAGCGAVLLANALIDKNNNTIRQFKVWSGIGLLILAVIDLIFALALKGNLVVPIIAVIIAVGLILAILVGQGKKWDKGDNHQDGYKNYYERKEEEKAKEEAEKTAEETKENSEK